MERALDEEFMRRAIELAKKGEGFCHPNPLVGAVIVKDGKVIGEGYHARYGDLHAERNAFKSLKESAEGATLYCTLEPCCHHGKQPPCTEAIIENKIKRVVVGSFDPNPLVSGKGFEILRSAGIEVTEGVLEKECDALNDIFFHYIKTKMPYVVMKYAMTADGKIATDTGKSKWITGEKSRENVQKLRHRLMGIMVGIGTVLKDDPMLNCRIEGLKSPIRIIVDSKIRIPLDSKICESADKYRTIVAYAEENADSKKLALLTEKGIETLLCSSDEAGDKVDIRILLKKLGEMGIDSILLEGGGELNASFVKEKLISEIKVFIGNKIFGGKGKSPVYGMGIDEVESALELEIKEIERFDDDVCITYIAK